MPENGKLWLELVEKVLVAVRFGVFLISGNQKLQRQKFLAARPIVVLNNCHLQASAKLLPEHAVAPGSRPSGMPFAVADWTSEIVTGSISLPSNCCCKSVPLRGSTLPKFPDENLSNPDR